MRIYVCAAIYNTQVLSILGVEASEGLTHREAWGRLLACGENELRPERGPGYVGIFLEEVYEGPQVCRYLCVLVGRSFPIFVFRLDRFQ